MPCRTERIIVPDGIQFEYLTPIDKMDSYPDAEEIPLLLDMHAEAKEYLSSHKWCTSIVESYLGYGVGKVIALFLFRLDPPIKGTDEWLWVLVGDLPSAYFVIDEAPNPAEALARYCELMEDWANAVKEGKSLDDVYPVEAAPTAEHAGMLLSRVEFIRKNLIPTALEPPPSGDEDEESCEQQDAPAKESE